MKFTFVNVICAAVILISGNYGSLALDPEPTGTTIKPVPTATSTVSPSTTVTSSTTSTIKPPPDTTTSTSTTITTTAKTTTSTVNPTTTTVKPTPAPTPQTGQWIVNNTKEICIILKMSAQFNVTYLANDNKTVTREIILPSDNSSTNVSGVCGDNEQIINIAWGLNNKQNNSFILHFVKNGTIYLLHHIEMYLANNELPNINSNYSVMLIHNTTLYKAGMGNSYRCAESQKISLASNVTNTTGMLEVKNFQFQAFRSDNSMKFGSAEDCRVGTQDIVPIAVGCALIALVVIVLVAYLIGRRRRQAGGYVSM